MNIIILLSIWSLFYHYYHDFIIIIYNIQKGNIDIGTKILKQKCFVHKTHVFNTCSNFPPAIHRQISSSIRVSYSRPPFRCFFFWKFACGLGFAGRGRRRTTDGRTDGTDGRTEDDDDGRRRRTDGTEDGRRTTTTADTTDDGRRMTTTKYNFG